MAVTQASVTANLGNGVIATRARSGTARELPMTLGLAVPMVRPRGSAGGTFVRLGAAITAASFAETASAVTPTTIPTVTQVTVSPAGYQASMGLYDDAIHRATEENDPIELEKDEIRYALQVYPGADSAVSIAYQFTQVTATVGTSGATLSRATLMSAANTVRSACNSRTTILRCLWTTSAVAWCVPPWCRWATRWTRSSFRPY